MGALLLASLLAGLRAAAGAEVVSLTTATFDQHLKDNTQTLVEFFAPWCGHCKKLAPEFEKAAVSLKSNGIVLGQVDVTEEKALASKYNIKGYPTLLWFEDAKQLEYDGSRTADGIIDWVTSMLGPAVVEMAPPGAPSAERPHLVLYAESLLAGFQDAAKENRRKASWYFVKTAGAAPRVLLSHRGEDDAELAGDACSDKARVTSFLQENMLPLFGPLDGDTFDTYMATGKGLVWSLFPPEEGGLQALEARHRPMMAEVARQIKGRYFVTYTDTTKFHEAIESMLGVTAFPAIAVQKTAGDKKKYVYEGEMNAQRISQFIADVDVGRVAPKLKSEPVPPAIPGGVLQVVGSTVQSAVFTPSKDVLLEVYAPWCGHCQKLEPEYKKLASKIEKEGLGDMLTIAKMDGTANDSPVDSLDWTGFPTIFFVKAGSPEATVYEGERTAKGLWKYIKKHATRAQEIKDRLERRKNSKRRGEDL